MPARWLCRRISSVPEGLPRPVDAAKAVRELIDEAHEVGAAIYIQPSLVPDPTHPGRFMVVALVVDPSVRPNDPALEAMGLPG